MPDHQKIKENKWMRVFGPLIHESNLWHLNRRSAKGAFAVGLFFAFWPVPFQMLLAILKICCLSSKVKKYYKFDFLYYCTNTAQILTTKSLRSILCRSGFQSLAKLSMWWARLLIRPRPSSIIAQPSSTRCRFSLAAPLRTK